MKNKNFIDGNYDTHFIENNQEDLMKSEHYEDASEMVIISAFIDYLDKISITREAKNEFTSPQSRWKKTPFIQHF